MQQMNLATMGMKLKPPQMNIVGTFQPMFATTPTMSKWPFSLTTWHYVKMPHSLATSTSNHEKD